MTTSGICGKSLKGTGSYPASICCNLTTVKPIKMGIGKQQTLPRITEENGIQYLADLTAGTAVIYKYFDLSETACVSITARGKGILKVMGSDIPIDSDEYQKYTCPISGSEKEAFTMTVISGRINITLLEFDGRRT